MIRIIIFIIAWASLLLFIYRSVKKLTSGSRRNGQKSFRNGGRHDPLRNAKQADVIDIE